MSFRILRAAAISACFIAAACSSEDSTSTPSIALRNQDGRTAYVEVTGLSTAQLRALRSAELTNQEWANLLRVAVNDTAAPMLGSYSVADRALRFTPEFALVPGRPYSVRFNPSRIPGTDAGAAAIVAATISLPAVHVVPSTTVTRIYPSGETVPENLLRIYVEFSDSMGRPSGIPHMQLLGSDGREIEGAFLPLDYEFWDPAHTRFTAFLDPGRVKSGILPNKEMGRALGAGRTVTLVISREWRDQHGLPLKNEYRRVLQVAPPAKTPLDPRTWRIEPAAAGSRNALVVTFPKPLDHGLLMRALGVMRNGEPVAGDVTIENAETRWIFTPREPWRSGKYDVVALDTLEDAAGNQIGRAFEVDNFETVDKSPNPQRIMIPFEVL